MNIINQIKSKIRVLDHGEVLTPSWLVSDMLDMIPANGTKISSRYLENSCGEGAFLVEILKRKLELIFNTYSTTKDLQFYTIVGISNIYGLELLIDNVEISKARLRNLIIEYFNNRYKVNTDPQFFKVIDYILNINIINMNALTYKTPIYNDNNLSRDESRNIVYSNELARITEWEIDYNSREVKRVEYFYRDIVLEQEDLFNYEKSLEDTDSLQLSLFETNSEYDLFDIKTYIRAAKPIRIFEKDSYINLTNPIIVKDGEINE